MEYVILVHGAFYNGSVWEKIIPALSSKNRTVYAPSLTSYDSPEVSLSQHADDVISLVHGILATNTPAEDIHITLIGHRYGGMVITEAVKKLPDLIAHLIYIDSAVPLPGESLVDILGEDAKKLEITNGKVQPSLKSLGLLKSEDIDWAQKRIFPQSFACFTEKTSKSKLPESLKTYLLCTLSPDEFALSQSKRMKKMGGKVRKIKASHSPMITEPKLLADELNLILNETV